MKHTVYVTPAGFICTCGVVERSTAGGEARRRADFHAEHDHVCLGYIMVDYRVRQPFSEAAPEAEL